MSKELKYLERVLANNSSPRYIVILDPRGMLAAVRRIIVDVNTLDDDEHITLGRDDEELKEEINREIEQEEKEYDKDFNEDYFNLDGEVISKAAVKNQYDHS